MTKELAYNKLFIMERQGYDISSQIAALATSDSVPESVEQFISRGNSTSNDFINSLSQKKFYKSLLSENLSVADKAKSLSSLITHLIIEHDNTGDPIEELSSVVPTNRILDSLNSYLTTGNDESINDTFYEVSQIIKTQDNRKGRVLK